MCWRILSVSNIRTGMLRLLNRAMTARQLAITSGDHKRRRLWYVPAMLLSSTRCQLQSKALMLSRSGAAGKESEHSTPTLVMTFYQKVSQH